MHSSSERLYRPCTPLQAVTMLLGLLIALTAVRADDESALVTELMSEAGIPGISLAVIRDGRIEQTSVFGVANLESGQPVTDETLFEAASLSKPVFAWIVMRLVERGELELDQPLHEILPYPRFADAEESRLLTPRLILSHQTGLPNWGGDVLPFMFVPGNRFGYSGEGYVYLQRVIEKLTGLEIEALAQREVFRPLGMKHSHFSASGNTEVSVSAGHTETGATQQRGLGDANAASSLHTTAGDYARFLLAVLNSDGLKATSVQQMLRGQIRMQGDERGYDKPDRIGGKVGWALGWGTQHGDQELVCHWGDNGVFRAFVVMRPADRSALVYFSNSSNGLAIGRQLLARQFADMQHTFDWLMYAQSDDPGWQIRRQAAMAESRGELAQAVALYRQAVVKVPDDRNSQRRIEWLQDLIRIASTPFSVEPEALSEYTGQFGPRRVFMDEEGRLRYQRGENGSYQLIPLQQHWFALKGLNMFRIEFEIDESGKATRIIGHYINGQQDESPRSKAE